MPGTGALLQERCPGKQPQDSGRLSQKGPTVDTRPRSKAWESAPGLRAADLNCGPEPRKAGMGE